MRKLVIIWIVELISSISKVIIGDATNIWLIMCLNQCIWKVRLPFALKKILMR